MSSPQSFKPRSYYARGPLEILPSHLYHQPDDLVRYQLFEQPLISQCGFLAESGARLQLLGLLGY